MASHEIETRWGQNRKLISNFASGLGILRRLLPSRRILNLESIFRPEKFYEKTAFSIDFKLSRFTEGIDFKKLLFLGEERSKSLART